MNTLVTSLAWSPAERGWTMYVNHGWHSIRKHVGDDLAAAKAHAEKRYGTGRWESAAGGLFWDLFVEDTL